MGIGRGGRGPCSLWIFIHDIDKVEEGLIVLFFGFIFFVALPGNFFADALGVVLCLKNGHQILTIFRNIK